MAAEDNDSFHSGQEERSESEHLYITQLSQLRICMYVAMSVYSDKLTLYKVPNVSCIIIQSLKYTH